MVHRFDYWFLKIIGLLFVVSLVSPETYVRAQDIPIAEDPLIIPPSEETKLSEAQIDTESIEIGLLSGVYSIDNFSSSLIYGGRIAYHLTEDVFFESAVGMTKVDQDQFINVTGRPLVDDENVIYWNISAGYNLFPGQIFATQNRTIYSTLFIIGGIGQTRFDSENHFTFNIGAGIKVFITDWLDLRLDFRDHIFETDITATSNLSHNLENTIGVSIFF